MKKLLKLFLMLTFSLLFLVACGEKGKEEAKSENTQKKTLTISWHQDIGFLNSTCLFARSIYYTRYGL